MTVSEALRILQESRVATGTPLQLLLACGFTPLHLGTLVAAEVQRRVPDRRVELTTGLYGDLAGTLERLDDARLEAAVVVVEWSDLDPRLGLREGTGWRPADLPDIVSGATAAAARLGDAVARTAERAPVAVSLPTLPLPPLGPAPGWQHDETAAELRRIAAVLAGRLVRLPHVRLVDPPRIDRLSPAAERLDAKAYLATGFPYRVAHAACLAEQLALLVCPPTPKKGLITDLDNVLWRGILGEDGPEGISWGVEEKTRAHALYQQLLHALADAGVLLAVASKSDPGVVERALGAKDLLVPRSTFFPVEAHWDPKSVSVGRILGAWNVGADSVVLVDDSPAEIAEVQAAFPDLEGIVFPTGDDTGVVALLDRLRDLFGKPRISEEDRLRRASLESTRAVASVAGTAERQDAFLAGAVQELTVLTAAAADDPRALELVNKTNQFNLNGRRFTPGEWRACLAREGAVLVMLSYRDRYGPLGKVSVLVGRRTAEGLAVDAWVLSCRAFSRRIEHAMLDLLFDRLGIDTVVLDYRPTPKNHLVKDFLAPFVDAAPEAGVRLTRAACAARRPPLFFRYVASDAA